MGGQISGETPPKENASSSYRTDPIEMRYWQSWVRTGQTNQIMKRPFSVTLALVLVLTLAAWNALKTWTSLAWRDVLLEYGARVSPSTGFVAGTFWFIIGLFTAWAVWRGKDWGAKWLVGAAAGYTVWYWSERLVWQNPRQNAVFAVVVNVVCVALVVVAAKSMSREAHERNAEDRTIE